MATKIEKLRKEIQSFFRQLSTDISNETSIGKNDKIHDLENYIKDFLNILYDLSSEGKFINLNTEYFNAEGVDLVSPARKEYIQVTVSNTSSKFKSSIEKASDYLKKSSLLEDEYRFIFFSFKKLNYKHKNTVISKYKFKEVLFWSIDDIIRKIDSASVEQLEKIYDIIRTDINLDMTVLDQIILEIYKKGKLESNDIIPKPYDILDKINYNQFDEYKSELLNHIRYSSYIEKIINEYENSAQYDIKNSIIATVFDEYRKIKLNQKIQESDNIMGHLVDNIKFLVRGIKLPVDMTLYITSLIAYVFCECRIFKRPKGKEEN